MFSSSRRDELEELRYILVGVSLEGQGIMFMLPGSYRKTVC